MFFSYIDEAVLSGSLIWKKTSGGYPRTKAEFTLSLALSQQYYTNVTVGSDIIMPGRLMFGDETETTLLLMTVRVFMLNFIMILSLYF